MERCEKASHPISGSSKVEPRAFCFAKLSKRTRVFVLFFLLAISAVCNAEDKPLWRIQKELASKKYVDFTHEFAPGIPSVARFSRRNA